MKKLLLLGLVLVGHSLWAQTDAPGENTTVLEESTSYHCENKVSGNFQGFNPTSIVACPGKDEYKALWYKFIPTKTAKYAIAVDQVEGGSVSMFMYKGTANNLTLLSTACSTRYTQMDFVAGETYYMLILGEFSTTQYAACIFALPDTPVNDEAENAIPLQFSTYGQCENTLSEQHAIGATISEENTCYGNREDVWYSVTPTEDDNYTFIMDFLNNSAVAGIGLYEGTPGNLNLISFGDDDITAVGCESVRAKATLQANTTYYLNVSILNTSRVSYFTLCSYKTPDAPVNDNCDNAIELTVGGDFDKSAIVGDITSATREERHTGPNCDFFNWATPNGNGKDVWFTATIPASGNLIVETRAYDQAERRLLSNTGMQSFVAGTCDALEPYRFFDPGYDDNVYCNSVFDYDQLGNFFAGIRFTNKTPGDKVLIRVYPWAHQYGRFRIAAYDDTALSINEFDKNGFAFYPNPTTDVVNVKYVNNITNLTVKNLLGKTVMTVNPNAKNTQLDLSALASGMYIVTAKSDVNEVTNFKVVKK